MQFFLSLTFTSILFTSISAQQTPSTVPPLLPSPPNQTTQNPLFPLTTTVFPTLLPGNVISPPGTNTSVPNGLPTQVTLPPQVTPLPNLPGGNVSYAIIQMKVGLLFCNATQRLRNLMGFGQSSPAITIAMRKIRKDHLIDNIDMTFVWYMDNCNEAKAVGYTTKLIQQDGVDAIIGPSCATSAIVSGIVAAYYNTPIYVWGAATASELADPVRFPTLGNVGVNTYVLGQAVRSLLVQYNWTEFALLYTLDTEQRKCDFLQQDIEKALVDDPTGTTIVYKRQLSLYFTERSMKDALLDVKSRARIILACFDSDLDKRAFLIYANDLGLNQNDEYVFIFPDIRSQGMLQRAPGVAQQQGSQATLTSGWTKTVILEMVGIRMRWLPQGILLWARVGKSDSQQAGERRMPMSQEDITERLTSAFNKVFEMQEKKFSNEEFFMSQSFMGYISQKGTDEVIDIRVNAEQSDAYNTVLIRKNHLPEVYAKVNQLETAKKRILHSKAIGFPKEIPKDIKKELDQAQERADDEFGFKITYSRHRKDDFVAFNHLVTVNWPPLSNPAPAYLRFDLVIIDALNLFEKYPQEYTSNIQKVLDILKNLQPAFVDTYLFFDSGSRLGRPFTTRRSLIQFLKVDILPLFPSCEEYSLGGLNLEGLEENEIEREPLLLLPSLYNTEAKIILDFTFRTYFIRSDDSARNTFAIPMISIQEVITWLHRPNPEDPSKKRELQLGDETFSYDESLQANTIKEIKHRLLEIFVSATQRCSYILEVVLLGLVHTHIWEALPELKEDCIALNDKTREQLKIYIDHDSQFREYPNQTVPSARLLGFAPRAEAKLPHPLQKNQLGPPPGEILIQRNSKVPAVPETPV
ncbi:receptor family ligand binding region domain-containing protein [Ditylenchus destructor]|nr:receptor family ligand binding region domain-containing protein [Ditylenchus destructor]